MRTFPIYRPDGSLLAFEIWNTWIWIGSLLRILRAVPGVSDVRRERSGDNRITFRFMSLAYVVNEPWGDNSRYWIGPAAPEESAVVESSPLLLAFKRHRTLWCALSLNGCRRRLTSGWSGP